jgi:subtilisin family serine protease
MRAKVLAVLGMGSAVAMASVPSVASATSGDFIVVLRPGASPAAVAADYGTKPLFTYTAALNGFAANIERSKASRLAADPRVEFVEDDRAIKAPKDVTAAKLTPFPITDIAQFVPRGVSRIGALAAPTAHIDGVDDPVDGDVAVIDSGVQPDQSDLRVAGGADCTGRGRKPGELTAYDDLDGHGTHVAGTVAAKDNSFGVVGVAPGARVWGIRTFTDAPYAPTSWIVCGIDWVAAHASTIEVANMSLGGPGADDGNCGHTNHESEHVAICTAITRGVTFAVAAGNESVDAANQVPAAYREVITVSALSDWDGKPGAVGGTTCEGTEDDTFAFFSNFGPAVDIAGPGVCIPSTWILNQVYRNTGTSMATPHVAGAALLYKTRHPSATPSQVRAAIIAARERYAMPGDPDGIDEGVLNVTGW